MIGGVFFFLKNELMSDCVIENEFFLPPTAPTGGDFGSFFGSCKFFDTYDFSVGRETYDI